MDDRTERYLARLDYALAHKHSDSERRLFLEGQLEVWQDRYSQFIASDGDSEFSQYWANPVHVSDYLLTIGGIATRLAAMREKVS